MSFGMVAAAVINIFDYRNLFVISQTFIKYESNVKDKGQDFNCIFSQITKSGPSFGW